MIKLSDDEKWELEQAISDAISDGEGRCDPDMLLHHLAKRKFLLVPPDLARELQPILNAMKKDIADGRA